MIPLLGREVCDLVHPGWFSVVDDLMRTLLMDAVSL
jgi:hypothetical protein